ncbi:MAG TPA: outer membrane beta-barrel protein [Chryseosolibacter sp.]
MRYIKPVMILAQLCACTLAWGQITKSVSVDSAQQISLSGSVDTYYHKAFNTNESAPRTSFSNLPGFSLGMINFVLEYSGSKTGVVTDLVFGPRGTDAIFNAPAAKNVQGGGSSHLINQMFVYYLINDHVRFNAGQFNTFVGYETITPVKNVHYSTSYLFSYGPFNHTGVWADLKFSEHCSAKVALMNPTDYTEFNPFNLYTIGGQLSVTGKNAVLNFNITYGDPDGKINASDSIGSVSSGNAFQMDFTGSVNPSEKFNIGLSTSLRSIGSGQLKATDSDRTVVEGGGYYGFAVYQTLALSASTKIALRTERFIEYNKGVGAIGTYTDSGRASVTSLTLSANFTRSNLRLIPELRLDKTSTESFTASSTNISTNQMFSMNLALVYSIPGITFKTTK